MPQHILFAHALDGDRPGAELTGDAVAASLEAPMLAWVHMDASDPASDQWIERHMAYLPAAVRHALTAEATRPRVSFHGDGAMVFLRGVNTNPGAEPEDMVSLRLWVDPARIVTLSKRQLAAVRELRADIADGRGPQDAGAFVAELLERLNTRIVHRVDALDDDGEVIEQAVLTGEGEQGNLRTRITDIRQELVDLRRYLRPQRDAAAQLAGTRLSLIDDETRVRIAEAQDVLTRTVEDLEGLAERLLVARDEIASAHSDRLNRNLYILSVISAVFLPLSFLTGLMGINLAGMPGAQWDGAFWTFTAGLCVMLVIQLMLLWMLRWVDVAGRRKKS